MKDGARTALLDMGGTAAEVEALVQALIGRLAASGERVLLDLAVGDIRCLVIRCDQAGPMTLLSPREREIARMVACGHPNKTIASVLEISTWTVASHLRRIFVKLDVSSRAAMVNRLASGGDRPDSEADAGLLVAPLVRQG
ncbi:LuxR C-terminal-related transcriptional regulator [Streptomyces sp. NPDC001536]|uniref:helix-turn-helix transcriptional regulator n=1 Tax=Streptomyces sp. NPDC001536 TaxID=3364583 RepID=UPI003696A780